MKIAVPKENNSVCAHFGHCEGFEVYNIEESNILDSQFVENPGHKPGFLPLFLKEQGVDMVITGGMGQRAQELFKENNIGVITGATGSIENVIKCYIKGDLVSTKEVCSLHAHEGECGE